VQLTAWMAVNLLTLKLWAQTAKRLDSKYFAIFRGVEKSAPFFYFASLIAFAAILSTTEGRINLQQGLI